MRIIFSLVLIALAMACTSKQVNFKQNTDWAKGIVWY